MSGVNKITREVRPGSMFESAINVIDSTVTFSQGDLLTLENGLLTQPDSETEGNLFLGIARCSITAGVLVGPYTGIPDANTPAITDIPGPQFGVIAKVVLKTSDSISPGGLVYLNPSAGTRHVQASGTQPIGVMQGAAVVSAAAGTEIEVLLACRALSSAGII